TRAVWVRRAVAAGVDSGVAGVGSVHGATVGRAVSGVGAARSGLFSPSGLPCGAGDNPGSGTARTKGSEPPPPEPLPPPEPPPPCTWMGLVAVVVMPPAWVSVMVTVTEYVPAAA